MTELIKPIKRKSQTIYKGRQLVLTLHPTYIAIRQSGKRSGYVLDYVAVFECAAKLRAREIRAEKMKGKKK